MNCSKQIRYIIRKGDNLYQLSRYYQTAVQEILAKNPGVDPYNLQPGSVITICPGESFIERNANPDQPACPDPSAQFDLLAGMSEAWEQRVYWTRLLLISIAERLKDQGATSKRLLKNSTDIANIYAIYYSADIAEAIDSLLTEHLQIGAKLITALRDGKTADSKDLTRQWYQNADHIAEALSNINPYYDREEVNEMMYDHLDLTTQEVAARLAENYAADIEAFNRVEQEALNMSDYLSSGIMRQFPEKFS